MLNRCWICLKRYSLNHEMNLHIASLDGNPRIYAKSLQIIKTYCSASVIRLNRSLQLFMQIHALMTGKNYIFYPKFHLNHWVLVYYTNDCLSAFAIIMSSLIFLCFHHLLIYLHKCAVCPHLGVMFDSVFPIPLILNHLHVHVTCTSKTYAESALVLLWKCPNSYCCSNSFPLWLL